MQRRSEWQRIRRTVPKRWRKSCQSTPWTGIHDGMEAQMRGNNPRDNHPRLRSGHGWYSGYPNGNGLGFWCRPLFEPSLRPLSDFRRQLHSAHRGVNV